MLEQLRSKTPYFWVNPNLQPAVSALKELPVTQADMMDAADRLNQFASLLECIFPELQESQGIIESPLLAVPALQATLIPNLEAGSLYIKADHQLPVAGSVKARGGIYEVLVIAERIALEEGLLKKGEGLSILASDQVRDCFSQHTISVGSTGNLGLSIGIMASALDFKAQVHMSSDAKTWKKERLRKRGVKVIEHTGDYASAVAAARQQAEGQGTVHFIDDENSLPLFLGYSVAAYRLKSQLHKAGIKVDKQHPLFVYIPCGVGGAPGGITFGLKQLFGDHVHCFFAEPVASPCMLSQLALDNDHYQSVYDLQLDNKTEADGLAVATASKLVASLISTLVSSVFTVTDNELFRYLYLLDQSESMKVEPSAAASLAGPRWLLQSEAGKGYLEQHQLQNKLSSTTHVLWTTGGAFVPTDEYKKFYKRGEAISSKKQLLASNE